MILYPDGLNVENMMKSFGANTHTYTNLIKEHNGYLGPFPKILQPGDVQSMVFTESNIGLFGSQSRRDWSNKMTR